MTYQIICFIIMLVVFISYVSFIRFKYGVQKSISASFYKLPIKQGFLFTLFCWGFAIPAIIIGSNGLMFLAGTGIAFVGAAAAFKQRLTSTVHFLSAGIAITASQLAIIIIYHKPEITGIFLILSLMALLFNKENYIWFAEIFAFISIVWVYALMIF